MRTNKIIGVCPHCGLEQLMPITGKICSKCGKVTTESVNKEE